MAGMSARPIFLVGCPRSGTTLLSSILHAHPNIAMPPETRFLLPAYAHRQKYGDLSDAANRRKLAEAITGKGSDFGDLKLDRARIIEQIVAAPPTLGTAFATIWMEFARARGASRWGEKRPAYWSDMDVIFRLFPTAQVIHLVRDPRAVVASLQKVPWYKRPVPDAAALWIQADRELRKVGRAQPGDSYHRLRYEDLMADPEGRLRALCAYLGEDFADDMLDHAGAASDIVPKRKTWHTNVHKPIDASRVDAWQGVLAPSEAGLIELLGRLAMHRNGYRPSEVSRHPDRQAMVRCLRRLAGIRVGITKRRIRDARLRRDFPVPLAAVT
jgi:hypothetical protein